MVEFWRWLHKATKELAFFGVGDNPKKDARMLLSYVTGKRENFILAFGETIITSNEKEQLDILLSKRKMGVPIAYIIGEHEFWSLPLYVSPITLIPRSDTESLVEQALIRLPSQRKCRVLDLGTGTGAIALALASERPDCKITATDLLPDIISLVQRNIARLGLDNINVQQSYWFNVLNKEQPFDLIVSNPPYIDKLDHHLTQGDLRFEPRVALVADNAGLADLEYIITYARHYLHTGSWLLLEHGWKQGKIVRALFANKKYLAITTYCDYNGNERLTLGCMP